VTAWRPIVRATWVAASVAWATPLAAQEKPAAEPAVGEVAPDFSLPLATRDGAGQGRVRLGDFKGRTVVLAFFYQARSKG
jgi:hypothetical protein